MTQFSYFFLLDYFFLVMLSHHYNVSVVFVFARGLENYSRREKEKKLEKCYSLEVYFYCNMW